MQNANAVDQRVGRRLRARRRALDLTQERLAALVGLTFQQIQKYERGVNRISASRLYEFCRVLRVSPGYFFDTLLEENQASSVDLFDQLKDRDCRALNEAFVRIEAPEVRRAVIAFIEMLGAKRSND